MLKPMSKPAPSELASRREWLAAAAAATAGAAAALLPGPGLAQALAGIALPDQPLRQRRLANGLQLIALPSESATVAVQLWYRVGAKHDPVGRSGFAHLFEHMMFKRTRHMEDEQFDRMTEDVGGSNNAFTAEDMTVYHSVVPPNHLEPILWAEAERMANLAVEQASFESEREVVKEEYRQRVLADPYGRLFNAIPIYGYQSHPYRRPVVGSMADLDAATLADVREFHDDHYRPDNAVLIVAGAFDPADLDRWVDHYFGSIPTPRRPLPRLQASEPRRRRDELHRMVAREAPLPAALVIWQGPTAASAEVPALRLAQALLALGDSARLNETLVYEQQLAQSAGFELMLNADAGLLVGNAIAAAGVRPDMLLAQLTREIQRIAEEPLPPEELARVKAQLLTRALVERETPEGRALAIGQSLLLRGDALAAERDLLRLQALSLFDVQRAMRRHVLQGASVSVLYGPAGKGGVA